MEPETSSDQKIIRTLLEDLEWVLHEKIETTNMFFLNTENKTRERYIKILKRILCVDLTHPLTESLKIFCKKQLERLNK